MKIFSKREVGLYRKGEVTAHNYFNNLLDQGMGIPEAVEKTKENFPSLSQRFYDYLGGTGIFA